MNFLVLQDHILDSTVVRVCVKGVEHILPNETLKCFSQDLLDKEVESITVVANEGEQAYLDVTFKD